jgi:hypothetical protein
MKSLVVSDIANMQFVAISDKLKLDFSKFENSQIIELNGRKENTKAKVLSKLAKSLNVHFLSNLDGLNDLLSTRGFGEQMDNAKWLAVFLEDLLHCTMAWNRVVDDKLVGKSFLFVILQCNRNDFDSICDMLGEVLYKDIRLGYVDIDYDE